MSHIHAYILQKVMINSINPKGLFSPEENFKKLKLIRNSKFKYLIIIL